MDDWMSYARAQWDRVAAWALIAIGAIMLLVGWLGVSDTGYVFEQLPYVVSGGVGGLFLLGIGGMLWVSADLRDEWRKLDALEQAIEAETDALRHYAGTNGAVTGAAGAVERPTRRQRTRQPVDS